MMQDPGQSPQMAALMQQLQGSPDESDQGGGAESPSAYAQGQALGILAKIQTDLMSQKGAGA